MTVDFYNVFTGKRMRSLHRGQENLVLNISRFRCHDIPVVETMALERAGTPGWSKKQASDLLRLRTADPDDADAADAEGSRNGRNGVFDSQCV